MVVILIGWIWFCILGPLKHASTQYSSPDCRRLGEKNNTWGSQLEATGILRLSLILTQANLEWRLLMEWKEHGT